MVATAKTFGLIGLVVLALFAVAGRAGATSFSGSDAFYFPVKATTGNGAIATSPDGNYVYVAAGNVTQYSGDGAFVRTFANKHGFVAATSIGTDLTGDVYVLYSTSQVVAKYTASGKYLTSWPVTFARAIGVSRGGDVFVLTNFLNAVGEYNSAGKSIGGFVANFPGQFMPWTTINDPGIVPNSGYDPPYKTDATAITVAPSGDPVLAGDSYQALSDKPPSCNAHAGFDDPSEYPDPLVSGEAVRFTSNGTLPAWGWLTTSLRDCFAGWHNEAENSNGVAVDPNNPADVYATSPSWRGVFHTELGASGFLHSDQQSFSRIIPEPFDGPSSFIAGNPSAGVAMDCHSNLYMLSNNADGVFVMKFLNQDQGQASSCFNPHLALLPTLTVIHIKPAKIKIGKEHLLMGCSGKPCRGTLTFKSASSLCPGCAIAAPRHFRIRPGLQTTLTVRLLPLGRRLLKAHPGFPIHVLAKVKGGRSFTQRTTLQAPTSLGERCSFAGIVGGPVDVSGTLKPGHTGEAITLNYLPPEADGLLVPAVQRIVRTGRAGRFADHYTLRTAGNWTVFADWGGDRTHASATSRPCSGTVRRVSTHLTLTCPASPLAGAPSQFSGTLTGAPADAPVSVVYEPPSEMPVDHTAATSSTGSYGDSLTPVETGNWVAFARYSGDAGHDAAQAECSFTVAPSDFSISDNPSSGAVAAGASVKTTVHTTVSSGASQTVSLSASGSFPGSVAFAPSTISAGSSSTVTITTKANATPGTYVITLTGTGQWATHSTTYKLTIR